jgi:DNA-binding NarL/FixJ family response regulator
MTAILKKSSKISIIWVDSDPTIYFKIDRFRSENVHVACFTETADALKALKEDLLKPQYIQCIITSMMERGGRCERGLLNGLEMLDRMKLIWQEAGIEHLPIFAVSSATADIHQCKQHGVDIIALNNLLTLQEQVIEHLKQRQYSMNGKPR